MVSCACGLASNAEHGPHKVSPGGRLQFSCPGCGALYEWAGFFWALAEAVQLAARLQRVRRRGR